MLFQNALIIWFTGTYVSDAQRAGFLFTEKNPNNSNSFTTSQ